MEQPQVSQWDDCKSSDPDRAINACTQLIQADGGTVDPSTLPKVLHRGDSSPEIEALQNLLAVLGHDVGAIDGVYGPATQQAILKATRGQRVTVRDLMLKGLRRRNLDIAYTNRGTAYGHKGEYDRAIADFDQAIQFNSNNSLAYSNRGYAYDAKGEYAKALIDFRVAASLFPASDPRKEEALARIAAIEKTLGQTQVVAPAPLPALTPPGSPNIFTGGGIVVRVSQGQIDGESTAFVSLSGEMKLGDEKYFNQALQTVDAPVVIVSLQGPGGAVPTGIKIGTIIWNNQYRTLVGNDFCVSMCAYAWLAGRPRYASADAQIGFHAPWKGDEANAEVSSVGSTILGGYLGLLGITTNAMAYMTDPGPNDEMQFLSAQEADQLGIYFKEWPR